jgi:monofunctional chorismate mutase
MNLDTLRKQIEAIDEKMMEFFEARMELSKKIGAYKKEHNLPVFDPKREQELINTYKTKLKHKEYIDYYESFLKHLMNLSKDIQK